MNKNLIPFLSNAELRELTKLETLAASLDKEIKESSMRKQRVTRPRYRRGTKPGRALTADEEFSRLVLTQHIENLRNERKEVTAGMNLLRNRAAKRRQQGWAGAA